MSARRWFAITFTASEEQGGTAVEVTFTPLGDAQGERRVSAWTRAINTGGLPSREALVYTAELLAPEAAARWPGATVTAEPVNDLFALVLAIPEAG